MNTTPGVNVPAGAVIQWSEHPTSSNNQFNLQALYGNTGIEQTVANTSLGSSEVQSGSAVVQQSDTVTFMTSGWGCAWTVTVYAGTQNGQAASTPSVVTPTSTTAGSTGYGPNQPPPAPTLADSYVYVGSVVAAYIDLKDGLVSITYLQQASNPPPAYCVVTHSEQDMTYVQSGVELDVKATYISTTPFTINPDGSIQHEVPQPNGTVATQRYVPGSNADYNAAVQKFEAHYPFC